MINRSRNFCFVVLQTIWNCFILINTINCKNDIKKIGKVSRFLLLGIKRSYVVKTPTISYIKNWDRQFFKRTNALNDLFSQLSGGQNPKNGNMEHFNLTPKLKQTVTLFQSMPNDPQYISQQVILLGKKCPPMPSKLKNRLNQVLGCQSTVYIYPKVEKKEDKKIITWLGDSDGLLTKGIVYILIDGLSGYTPEEIIKVDPNFILLTGITEFLTMSRINGYHNIMNRIKVLSKHILENTDR